MTMTLEHRPAVAEVKSNGKNVLALRSNDYVGQTDRTEGKKFYARPNQFQSVSRRRRSAWSRAKAMVRNRRTHTSRASRTVSGRACLKLQFTAHVQNV